MKKVIVLFTACLLFAFTADAQRPKDNIVINKRPSTVPTTQTQQQQNSGLPTQQKSTTTQTRVNHDYSKKLDQIELRYSIQKTGQNSKNTFYKIIGNIYSDNLQEALFSYNKRIVLIQVDNWDSGFFGDNIESIDGYATSKQLNAQAGGGVLYQFGNSAEREFSFEFKVKNGQTPSVKAQIYPDWRVYSEYESYLVLDYTTLSGNWNQEGNTDSSFALQFNSQGNQIVMKDLLGQEVYWTAAKEKTYVRQIGNIPAQNASTNQTNSSTPAGGYLGDSNNNSNQNSNTNSNNSSPSNYPSGGYLGGGNNSSNQNSNQTQNSNQSSNSVQQVAEQGYSSVIEIVDNQTIKYYNSEGIVVTLVKGQ